MICAWAYNNTGGSLLIAVLFHATANFGLTAFLEPLGSRSTVPFLLYVALTTVAAILVTVTSGATHLSRTHQKHTTQGEPQPAIPATHECEVTLPVTQN